MHFPPWDYQDLQQFFKPYDRDNTGALTFASFASGLESLQSATGVVLGGADVGRLLRDFDGGNGFVSYRKLCDLIESMRMSEAVFGRKIAALVNAGKECGLDIDKLLSSHMKHDFRGNSSSKQAVSDDTSVMSPQVQTLWEPLCE